MMNAATMNDELKEHLSCLLLLLHRSSFIVHRSAFRYGSTYEKRAARVSPGRSQKSILIIVLARTFNLSRHTNPAPCEER